MNSTELNTILAELTSAVRKRFSLTVENSVAIVMQSQLASDLQTGKCEERNINALIGKLIEIKCLFIVLNFLT